MPPSVVYCYRLLVDGNENFVAIEVTSQMPMLCKFDVKGEIKQASEVSAF